jgi:propanol-preferring alcohol dehydrogenase
MTIRALRRPLILVERLDLTPGLGQVRVVVEACAVCRTDLHVVDGDLLDPKLPIVPAHEIVGRVDALGYMSSLVLGKRVGVPWLGRACGHCSYCEAGRTADLGKVRTCRGTGNRPGGIALVLVVQQPSSPKVTAS